MSKLLTADDILHAKDLKRERLELPEWGGHLYIRTMTGVERDAWEASMVRSRPKRINGHNVEEHITDMRNARAKLVARVACDEEGKSIFTEAQIDALGKKSAAALDRCFDVAKRLNHLSSDDMEELAGNSDGGQNVDSGSASPSH